MNTRSVIAPLIGLSAFAALVWSISGLEKQAPIVEVQQENRPRYTAQNVEWTHLGKAGTAEFHLTADTADYYDDDSAQLSAVVMDRFTNEQGAWRVTAPEAKIPAGEKRVLLQTQVLGNGKLQNGRDVMLNTTRLWVDTQRNELYTDAPVEMTSPEWQASGIGLRADLSGEKLELLKNSKVVYVSSSR